MDATCLVVMTMVIDNIYGLDNVGMLESGAYTEFCSDLFLVLFFAFACALGPKLLDSVYMTTVLAFDKTNSAASTTSKDFAPFAVFFGEVGLGGVVEGLDDRMRVRVVVGRGMGGRARGGGSSILALLDWFRSARSG